MRGKLTFVATAAAAAMTAAPPAVAVPVVKTYQTISRFTTGPIEQVTSIFTLSFDPSLTSGPAAVTNYSSSVGDASFDPALVQFQSQVPVKITSNTTVVVGGSDAGPNDFLPGTADFRIVFVADRVTGDVPASNPGVPFYAATFYQLPTSSAQFQASDVTISLLSSAVPESATWGMMMLGIGAIGVALRRRMSRVTTEVTFG